MKIYTKTGDTGTTSLVGGVRVGKDDPRVDAYGCVDELTAFTAYLRDTMADAKVDLQEYRDDLRSILETLMKVGALLASAGTSSAKAPQVTQQDISILEQRIDTIAGLLEPLTRFVIPGGDPLVSLAHICRTVCRRAERAAVGASHNHAVDSNAMIYLNRLSDYLYQLSRRLTSLLGVREEYWDPA